MKMMHKNIFYGSLLMFGVCGMTSCIDEDMSDCPPFEKEIVVTYQLEVAQDVDLGFSTGVNSLHLGFWNNPTSLYRERMVPKSELPEDLIFRVTLPVDNYSHVAVANNELSDGSCAPFPANLEEAAVVRPFILPDTIQAVNQPAYAGKLDMAMGMNYENETYKVLLSPVSSKYAIHVSHPSTLKDMKCFISGIRQGYSCWQQVWLKNDKIVADASDFATRSENNDKTDFTFYSFPTLTVDGTKADMQDGWWKLYFYSKLDDKIIQHKITVKEPVEAGQVFVMDVELTETGGEVVNVDAGVEFDPDWEPGNDYDIDM